MLVIDRKVVSARADPRNRDEPRYGKCRDAAFICTRVVSFFASSGKTLVSKATCVFAMHAKEKQGLGCP